jgi:GDPmannose 4,6-dehydratase
MVNKIALIIGAGGQDGSYLAEFLLSKNYEVHGILRQSSVDNTQRVSHLMDRVQYHMFDINQPMSSLLYKVNPDEIYNLSALSFVKTSFDMCKVVTETNFTSVQNLLEEIRLVNPSIKFYQASTSEMFGSSLPPQSETTPFCPNSPYAISKLAAYWTVKAFREAYGLFAANGILFNHESPRRASHFVTKKICKGVADIYYQKKEYIELGNLNAKRDWGHTVDYVKAMWLILQHDVPDDFVVGTGRSHSVKEFVEIAFKFISMNII